MFILMFISLTTLYLQDIYGKWDDLDKLNPERPGWVYEGSLFNGKDIIAEALSQLIGHPAYRGTQIGAGEDI